MENYSDIIVTTEVQQLIQSNIAYHYGIIPKYTTTDSITFYVKKTNNDSSVIEELELVLGKEVVLEPIEEAIIDRLLATYYRSNNQKNPNTNFELRGDFLEDLIWDAKSTESSDIHFEVFKSSARIRFRIDGKLIERYKVKIEDYAELVNKIKIKANLNITEKRLPQDGRINYDEFDIRVSVLPTLYGEKVVMRILGKDTSNLSFEKLGMDSKEKEVYLKGVKATKGIILISGPTGSGKTTTLYATLKLLNKITDNVITIEDPIEYTLEGINQVQLKEEIGLTFERALKTFLRQDPDIIMLGEIRDEKTAKMAIRASLTGHLVLSTIHTNSAIGTISRLIDMGVPSFLIAETLNVSVAQRLVRKLCNNCKIKKQGSKIEISGFKKLDFEYVPVGCDTCYHTGYVGRTAIYEIIPVTDELINLINTKSSTISEIKYKSLSQKAFKLMEEGVTTLEEVYPILIEDKQDR